MAEPDEPQSEDPEAAGSEETVEPALPADLERPAEDGDPNGQPV